MKSPLKKKRASKLKLSSIWFGKHALELLKVLIWLTAWSSECSVDWRVNVNRYE